MEKKKTMYAISENYLELMNEIEEAEGILTPEMESALDINKEELKVKSASYYDFIQSLDADSLTVKAEIDRLTKRKKRNDALSKLLKDRLLGAVIMHGDFTSGTLDFGTRKSQSIVIEDEDEINKKFKISKVTTSIDKKAIKEAIKSGETVKGAILQDNKNLKIK